MKRSRTTLRDVLEKLLDEGDIQGKDIQSIEEFIITQKEKASQPWYIRGCAGFSAWLAALFFTAFLAYAEIITDGIGAFIIGLIFCAVAIGISRSNTDSDFAWQGALALCLTGQLLFLYGIYDLLDVSNITLIMLATVALEIVLIWLYNDRLLRFISTVAIITAITVLIDDLNLPNLIPFLSISLAVGIVIIWENEVSLIRSKMESIYQPVGYGITLGMLGVISLPVVSIIEVTMWWVSTVGLLLILLAVIYRIVAYHNLSLQAGGVILAFMGAVLLAIPAIQIPGIIGSLTILLLGFHKGNQVLMGIAGIFLAYFVTLFYYDIDITLLLKSIALIGSGILFLLIRYGILRLLFQQEGKS